MYLILLFYLMCRLKEGFMMLGREELLLQDPSLWPGHLEPFGSHQVSSKIEELVEWPDPLTFFQMYVDKSKPVLFKGLSKQSPGYAKFHDEYFKNAPGADKTMIYAEPEIKENRTKEGYTISIKEFVERYHKETLYMVNALPQQFCPDVRMPAPLRCENTRDLLSSQVTWFSQGGTKSVLHNDDVDNINCLFRGSKELWMIEYMKNKHFVPIDHAQGGYSSLDVEKVNYTAFPDLRKVDMFYKANMEEGDCLFIPYHWFHQVNSFGSINNMNLAVNIWFKHEIGHVPKNCIIPESEATIDKYRFPDDEAENEGRGTSMMEYFSEYTKIKEVISFNFFLKVLKRDKFVNPTLHKVKGFPDELQQLGIKLFNVIDATNDGKITNDDWIELDKLEQEKYDAVEESMNMHVADIENYFEDLVDEDKKSKLSNNPEPPVQSERINKDEF